MWQVNIGCSGRAGSAKYIEADHSIEFWWELGGVDVVAVIVAPPPQAWNSEEMVWTCGRRREILNRVAEQIIRLCAPNSVAEITDGDTAIILRRRT